MLAAALLTLGLLAQAPAIPVEVLVYELDAPKLRTLGFDIPFSVPDLRVMKQPEIEDEFFRACLDEGLGDQLAKVKITLDDEPAKVHIGAPVDMPQRRKWPAKDARRPGTTVSLTVQRNDEGVYDVHLRGRHEAITHPATSDVPPSVAVVEGDTEVQLKLGQSFLLCLPPMKTGKLVVFVVTLPSPEVAITPGISRVR